MKYRREIDGLRAVAVVPVILFHAGFAPFSGGFVGVDVFFVISGYLITTILIEDLVRDRFSLLRFYERRARRILPALVFVVACCLPFAWFWMLPDQLEAFSRSLIAVALFASNILFWRESGYFSAEAEEKPLLHTWSLAVEEQYYVFFPLFLFFAWRFGRQRVFWLIVLFACASLALSEWGWRNKPEANFYLAPTRAWELFAGSIAAFMLHGREPRASNALSLAGLGCILAAMFLYDGATPFPSLYSLLPVAGVVLIILFGTETTLAGRLLSRPLCVGIGLVSYSAYLWHQPLFAFARLRAVHEPSALLMAVLAALSFGLACLSWRFVEQPFRARGPQPAAARVLGATAAVLAAVLLIGALGVANKGFMGRLTPAEQEIYTYNAYPRADLYRSGTCFLDVPDDERDFAAACFSDQETVLLGDSYTASLAAGFRDRGEVGQLTASGCPPVLAYRSALRPNCGRVNGFRIAEAIRAQPETVILNARWSLYMDPASRFFDAEFPTHLAETIGRLKAGGIEDVVVIGGFPEFHPTLPRRLLAQNLGLDAPRRLDLDLAAIAAADEDIRRAAGAAGARYLSVLDALCDAAACDAVVEERGGYYPIAWDYGHLTAQGSRHIVRALETGP